MKFSSLELQSGKALNKNILMANGLGGYTSIGVYNNSFRKHDGYLVGSLESPAKRYIFLKRTTEYVNGVSLDSSLTTEGQYAGYKYMTDFSYDITPKFTYTVKGAIIKKEISPIYGKNACAITYEIKASEQTKVDIVFEFAKRESGQVNEVKDLDLVLKEDDEGFYVPYMNLNQNVYLYLDGNSVKPLFGEYSKDIIYEYDDKMGDKRTSVDQKVFSLEIDLMPNETKKINIVASLSKLDKINATELIIDYKSLIESVILKSEVKDPFLKRLVKSSFQFISYRESTDNLTILAGFPWFTDWGRDTMISLTGICLSTKRYSDALSILKSFKSYLKDGLIPNSFLGENDLPIYNSVDAPLWYINSVYKYVIETSDFEGVRDLYPVCQSIIKNYKSGTIFDIYMNEKGLIHAGNRLDQLTWMDVRINGECVTPRHGYPVEINALWYNSLMIMNYLKDKYDDKTDYLTLAKSVKKNFILFIKPDGGLYDVIEPNDPSVRPNQLYAYTLPFKVLDKELAKKSFLIVKEELFNKYGLRSLSNKDPRFIDEYSGSLVKRDHSYHMGTSWTFLIGIYIDALCYLGDYKASVKKEAKSILYGFSDLMNSSNLDGICEIYDGKGTFEPKGCYNQAWGVAEVLRSYIENLIKK